MSDSSGNPGARSASAKTQAEAMARAQELLRRTTKARRLTVSTTAASSGLFIVKTSDRAKPVKAQKSRKSAKSSAPEPKPEQVQPTVPAPALDSDHATSDLAHREALINRLAAARRAGRDDPEAAEALLRRAAGRNRAALDRLSR
ncbi:hypothetical protein ABT297_19670 [Dactylosporangium sp. NPDC000555]|uniref:hypothetical protein n=1 Tax=Dactylosporangium sp. NPDC000555 TaxID=3154260 RepID=UPI0033309019